MFGWRWRCRRGKGRGRPMKPRYIGFVPPARFFVPMPQIQSWPLQMQTPPITLTPDECEVVRLVDLEGLSQEEAGKRMGISRGTVWRILKNARLKIAQAIIEGRPIMIVQMQQKTPLEADSGKEKKKENKY